jgi:hypothetical protein
VAQGDLRGTLTGSVNSVTNPTVASGSVSVSVGDLVFGTMSQQTALSASGTVTDNLGNTYAYVNAGTDGGTVAGRSFYARVTVAGTLTTVNVPATASANDASVVADVIEGPFLTSPLDASLANATDATTPFTCTATGVMAQASNVVMAAISIAGAQTVAATSPSTICGTVNRANASVGQSRRVVSATTSIAPEFTGTSATAVQTTAAFKLSPPTQGLTPSLFTNSQTFHAPTVAPGSVDLTPSLHTNAQTFYAPTVAFPAQALTPDLFSNAQTFHSPTVAATYDLTPALHVNAQTFHASTVAPGSVDLTPSLHSNAQTFYAPAVAPGAVDLTPSLYTNSQTFHSPTVELEAAGAQDLTPSLFTNSQTFHGPTVAAGAVGLAPSLFTNAQVFHAATVTPGAVDLTPSLISNAQTFYGPTVQAAGGTQDLTPSLFTNTQTFHAATVAQPSPQSLTPGLFTNGQTFFSPTVSPGAAIIVPSPVVVHAPTRRDSLAPISPARFRLYVRQKALTLRRDQQRRR